MVLYFDSEDVTDDDSNVKQRRIIRTKPTRYYEAGDRTGKLPETIELDYEKFLVAYKIAVSGNQTAKPATNSNRSNPK